jgi:hypothetical protein
MEDDTNYDPHVGAADLGASSHIIGRGDPTENDNLEVHHC